MDLTEWDAAVVDGPSGSVPTADSWTSVTLPASLPAGADGGCVALRTTFEDPREGEETRGLLRVEGAYARSRVWLNGELLGTADDHVRPATFTFAPAADNELVVECLPPTDRFGGSRDTDAVPAAERAPGIRGSVEVTGVGDAAVTDLSVAPAFGGEDDPATVRATATVAAAVPVDDAVTFSVRPRGFRGGGTMERAPVTAAAGETVTVTADLSVRNPRRWYPRGYGAQHHYAVAARFGGREVSRTTGFADVTRDDDGLRVNGRRVRLRGFDVLPTGDPAVDVERALDAGANLLRLHAHVRPAAFYRDCDEAGLMVFQDLPLTGPGGYDIDRGRELAGGLSDAVAHHPSVGLYGVHDDPRELFPDPVGGGRRGRYRVRWRAWRNEYNDAADRELADALPDDAPVFPVCGGVGLDADATHLYPGWKYGTPGDAAWLLERNPGLGEVVTEFGAGSLVDADGRDAAGFDAAHHDARVDGDVDASQAYQARTVGTVAETLRRAGADVLAAYTLRDADEGAGMGVLTADGEEKPAFETLSEAYQAVVPTLVGPPGSGSRATAVVNDTGDAVEGTLAWTAGDEEGADSVAVDPFDTAAGPTVTVPGDADAVELALSLGGRTVTNTYPLR